MVKRGGSKSSPPDVELIGSCFHSFIKREIDGNSYMVVKWQGEVLSSPMPGYYLVQLYEWFMGQPSNMRLVKIDDMLDWIFYEKLKSMTDSYNEMPTLKDNSKGYSI